MLRRLAYAALALCLGCSSSEDPAEPKPKVFVTPAPEDAPWEQLSEWNLFADAPAQQPAERVVPYTVISQLWADHAQKHRFMHVPEGATVEYSAQQRWKFPVGTILVKTFAYPVDARDPSLGERLLETRLLIHESPGWVGHTYVWNEEQTEATRVAIGKTLDATWIDENGETQTHQYGVPDTNKCRECHGEESPDTLGGTTRQLDRDYDYGQGPKNQIDHLEQLGFFASAPSPAAERERLVDPFGAAPVAERARAYLDSNCAHCHSDASGASQSGLLLNWFQTAPGSDAADWGVCKVPTSAGGATCGLTYDIVPGDPDQSILVCRVTSREPKVQMPPLATKLADPRGVALMRDWISGLSEPACN